MIIYKSGTIYVVVIIVIDLYYVIICSLKCNTPDISLHYFISLLECWQVVVPNFPKNSHTTRFYLYCLVMKSKRLNNVTLCPSSLSTFHILIFSEETNNWNIVESIGINLQEWCLWGSLWKIPHIMATLQNTWSPLAVLIFSFDWLKL